MNFVSQNNGITPVSQIQGNGGHSLSSLLLVCYAVENVLSKGLPQMEETAKKPGGKRLGQKYKSIWVWDILLKKTDESHALQMKDIKEHLSHYGITAEQHSIKRDIDDMLALLNKEIDFDLDELEIEERDLLVHLGKQFLQIFVRQEHLGLSVVL